MASSTPGPPAPTPVPAGPSSPPTPSWVWISPAPSTGPATAGASGSPLVGLVAFFVVVRLLATFLFAGVVLPALLPCDRPHSCGGGGNTPIGSAFGFSPSTAESVAAGGTALPGCAADAAGTDYCEVIQISAVSSGLTTAQVGFELTNPGGASVPFASVVLLDVEGGGIARYAGGPSGGSWTACTPTSCSVAEASAQSAALPVALSTSKTLVLQVGPANGGAPLMGDQFTAYGVGSFSGSITSTGA